MPRPKGSKNKPKPHKPAEGELTCVNYTHLGDDSGRDDTAYLSDVGLVSEESIANQEEAITLSPITIPHNFTPRDYQLAALIAADNPQYNRFLFRWSRRAGKDKTCFNIMVKKALERVGLYFYVFPTYSQGRKALWENLDADGFAIMNHIPECLIDGKPNQNEMKIKLVNGSIIRLAGSDNIDSLRGTNPIGIVFSEFADQSLEVWSVMEPVLLQNNGWAIFNGTPKGKNHMWDMECRAIRSTSWYVSEIQSLWADLPNFYPVNSLKGDITENFKKIEQARESGTTEEMIEQEYGASYIAGAKGNYYSDQIILARNSGRIGNFPYCDQLYVDTFWDLGWSDDTSVWFKQVDGRANIFIDYYENNTKDLSHYIEMMREKGYRYRNHYLPHDAHQGKFQTGFSNKDTFMRLCQQAGISSNVFVASKPATKQDAINAVRARFSSYYFNEQTTGEAVIKLSLYHRKYDKIKRVFLETPTHDFCSHCADALTTEALSANLQEDILYDHRNVTIKTDFDPFSDT